MQRHRQLLGRCLHQVEAIQERGTGRGQVDEAELHALRRQRDAGGVEGGGDRRRVDVRAAQRLLAGADHVRLAATQPPALVRRQHRRAAGRVLAPVHQFLGVVLRGADAVQRATGVRHQAAQQLGGQRHRFVDADAALQQAAVAVELGQVGAVPLQLLHRVDQAHVGIGAGAFGPRAVADLAQQQPVDHRHHDDADRNAEHRQRAQDVGAAPAGEVALRVQATFFVQQAAGDHADPGGHLQRLVVDPVLRGGQATGAVALQVGFDLGDALLAQVVQRAHPRGLLRIVADQQRQPVQQRLQLLAVVLVLGQVVDPPGQQMAALGRLGIAQARLDRIDAGDHLVGVRDPLGVGDEPLRTDQHPDPDRDEDQRGDQQTGLVGEAGATSDRHGRLNWTGNQRTLCPCARGYVKVCAGATASRAGGPGGRPRSGCQRRACRWPRTGSCAPCPATGSAGWRSRPRSALRRPGAAPGARGR